MSPTHDARSRFVAAAKAAAEKWPGLEDLAHRHGVTTEFTDWKFQPQAVNPATLKAVLAALGITVDSPQVVLSALAQVDAQASQLVIPPSTVIRAGQAAQVKVNCQPGPELRAWVELDSDPALGTKGGRLELDWASSPALGRLPANLPLGWHTLCVQDAAGPVHQGALVVCPERLELPDDLAQQAQWGPMVQLYAMRSRQSWGLGDFVDLADLGRLMGQAYGADFVLINPIHAAEPIPPLTQSPYLPTTRDFLHPIYIRPQATAEYLAAPAAVQLAVDQLGAQAAAQAAGLDELDRDAAWECKRQALEILFRQPRGQARQDQLDAYVAALSPGIADFALWNALVEAGQVAQVAHGSEAAARFASQHAERLAFYQWLQLLAAEQLAEAQAACLAGGMRIGIIKDLAVGVHPTGSDVWSRGTLLAKGMAVGAPPDYFNQVGQDWSEPPWRPDALAAEGYRPLRTMLRAVLASAGALRIDHILGLFRLWWIPTGMGPGDGTYVTYDHEAMCSVLVLEAHRAGALVVGEDLGVVAPGVPEYLASRGVLGTSIAWFERAANGVDKLPPDAYRRLAMTTLTTHDLPPTNAYLAGEHVAQRARLGLLDVPLAQAQATAAEDRGAMVSLLLQEGFLDPADQENVDQIVLAMHRLLKATPSVLLGVSLSDLVGDRRSQNLPGTDREYPNWSVPLTDPDGQPVYLEDIEASPTFQAIVKVMQAG